MTNYSIPSSREEAEAIDRDDPLTAARDKFHMPDSLIYLDGHSLGPAPKSALAAVAGASGQEWAGGLIRSWNDAGWIDLPSRVGAHLAQLIGAKAEDVIVCDSVSINLFKLAAAALPLAGNAGTLTVEEDEFPTDQYIIAGLSGLVDVNFIRAKAGEGAKTLAEHGGVLIKSVVNYRTAAVVDMSEHEQIAKKSGGVIVWDLSHATGVIAVDLNAGGARLATGCTYKYVNGGPGAPAFVYVRRDIAPKITSPLSGWMGHASPFDFSADYQPKDNVARFAAGTPPILSLSALSGALDVFDDVDMHRAAAKARALGDLCLSRAEQMDLPTVSPGVGEDRGGHVSLLHENGYAIVQALIAENIIADFRAPNAMRFGFSPLYVSFTDVWDAMNRMEEILETRSWDKPEFRKQSAVT